MYCVPLPQFNVSREMAAQPRPVDGCPTFLGVLYNRLNRLFWPSEKALVKWRDRRSCTFPYVDRCALVHGRVPTKRPCVHAGGVLEVKSTGKDGYAIACAPPLSRAVIRPPVSSGEVKPDHHAHNNRTISPEIGRDAARFVTVLQTDEKLVAYFASEAQNVK